MSNTPEQDAYLALLRLPHNGPRSTQAMQSAMATLRDHIAEASGKDPELAQSLAEQVTAFEASRAAPDDVVERVARAIGARHEAGYVVGSLYSENMRELARAALSALPARDEALEGLLAKALRRLAYWAQTSGGTAGRDDGLVAAIDVGLAALRQYDTKHAAPAQEPRS